MNLLHQRINVCFVAALILITPAVESQTENTNPVCNVCGGDPNATVRNPNLLVDIPPDLNSGFAQATCQQIYQAGLDNLITVEQCDAILLNVDAQTLCECSNIDSTPICYVCGGDPNATVTNPDLLVDIPPELNAEAAQASCLQIYQAGLNQLITREQCDAILLNVDAQAFCGCSNIVDFAPNSTPTTKAVPVPVPVAVDAPQLVAPTETNPPVEIPPSSAETDLPGTTMPHSVDVGIESSTKCKRKGKGTMREGESICTGNKKGGMKMEKKYKKPKEPKTPKVRTGDKGMR
jgi:hypothetical protein